MLVVVKVTVVVGDNKQTKQTNTLSSSFFLLLFFLLFFDERLTKSSGWSLSVGKRSFFGRLFELSDVELSSTSPNASFTF